MNGFTVSSYFESLSMGDENNSVPPHELIVRPLIRHAELAVIFDAPTDSRPIRESSSILIPQRGSLRLDLSKELIRGYERLWNASAGTRGCIAVKSRLSKSRLSELFRFCGDAWIWDKKSECEVFGTKALRFAGAEIGKGARVFLFSRSNGIQWMGVYSTADDAADLFEIAKETCKPFKRWFEVSEPEEFNIIGEYHKVKTHSSK